jgi:hypothetical protein
MSSVRIRMFRQGIGDCFLLTFPGRERESHVLIDCGVLLGTADAQATMRTAAERILEATNGQLDVLVATHEHWDHVSGFVQAQDLFAQDKLKVGEVWLAWTENRDDPQAKELGKRRASAIRRLAAATQQLSGVADLSARRTAEKISAVLEFWGGLAASARGTTRSAMEWVKNRTDPVPPRFLYPGMAPFPVPGVDDVRVYVLGPPRDPKLLKKSDPSKKSSEVYELGGDADADFGFFAALDALNAGSPADGRPFEDWFRLDESTARQRRFFQDHYGFEGDDWRRIEHDWLGLAGRLALQLDSDTNNTSLVLAFELGKSGRVLLFPADAQVGNWLSWHGIEWKIEEHGRTKTVTARDLLERTTLYKVGHHGSHNATLEELGLELMVSDELVAMLPVKRAMAKQMKWQMPFPSLFRRLQERSKGRILEMDEGVVAWQQDLCTQREWDRFIARTKVTAEWIDIYVDN